MNAATIAPSPEINRPIESEPMSVQEHMRRVRETMHTIQTVSRMAGKELPLVNVNGSAEMTDRPAIYLLQNENSSGMERLEDASFDLRPELMSGTADSAHAVVSGVLNLDFADNRGKQEVRVAAKNYRKRTFDDRMTRATRELTVMQDMERRGALTTRPIAMVVTPESQATHGEVIILTRHNLNLLTMDNNPWGRGLNQQNIELAQTAVRALGNFNVMGWRHGDAKIKNVAQDELGGETNMIDYETTVPIDLKNPQDVMTTAFEDFGLMINSLRKRGFVSANQDAPDLEPQVLHGLADAYLDCWAGQSESTQAAAISGVISVLGNLETIHGVAVA